MPHCEAVLQQLFNYANQTSKSMKNSGVTNDTLGYLIAVKAAFRNYNMEKYDQFLKVLTDFSAKRIHISDVKAKLKTLFKWHYYLILEFNSFVPMQHQITVSSEDGICFLQAVKFAIENNYHDFPKVVKDFNDQIIDITCLTDRVEGAAQKSSSFNFGIQLFHALESSNRGFIREFACIGFSTGRKTCYST